MRDLVIDLRRGGGSPSEILWGTVTIQGLTPRTNGTSTVLWETTAKLVNGQYTFVGAQETPVDNSWHYRIIAKDALSEAGFQWRVFLPVGAGAANLVTLQLAW